MITAKRGHPQQVQKNNVPIALPCKPDPLFRIPSDRRDTGYLKWTSDSVSLPREFLEPVSVSFGRKKQQYRVSTLEGEPSRILYTCKPSGRRENNMNICAIRRDNSALLGKWARKAPGHGSRDCVRINRYRELQRTYLSRHIGRLIFYCSKSMVAFDQKHPICHDGIKSVIRQLHHTTE